MQKLFFIVLVSIAISVKGQQTISKKVQTSVHYIDIYTQGIDDLTIEQSTTGFVEIILMDADIKEHTILVEHKEKLLTIEAKFNLSDGYNKTEKYCVIPPNYVNAVLKVPKNKTVTIFGSTIDIESKSYNGNFKIYIDNGNIKLNDNNGNTSINLFSGNISATLTDSEIDITTNKGKIWVNDKESTGSFKKYSKFDQKFLVKSINANVVLTTLKTQ